jgi:hypothetical protein
VRTTQNPHLSPTFWTNEKGRKEHQQATLKVQKIKKLEEKHREFLRDSPVAAVTCYN